METLKLEDLTKYKFISNLKLSPDNNFAAFVISTSNLNHNNYDSNIYLYDFNRKSVRRLTTFNNETNYEWLDNSEDIIFSSARDDEVKAKAKAGDLFTQFYKINVHGGEAVKYFSVPFAVNSLKQIDDDNFLLSIIYQPKDKMLDGFSDEEREKKLKGLKEENDYTVLDEIPFWFNGSGYTNKFRVRLYLYNKTSSNYEPLTGELTDVEDFNFNKDRTKIVFTSHTFKDKLELTNNIYIYDLKDKTTEALLCDDKYSVAKAYFSYDEDKVIFLGSDMKHYGVNENPRFFSVSLLDKKTILLNNEFNKSTWNSVGSDCRYGSCRNFKYVNSNFYFTTTEEDSSYLNKINENGVIKKVISTNGSVDDFDVNKNTVIFSALRSLKLQELYTIDNNDEVQLTHFNSWVNEERKLSDFEPISIINKLGTKISGYVLKPVNFDSSKKYPGILDIHGGPKTVYGKVFYHEMQLFASMGYFVFFCNPTGSNGRDDEFSDIRGKYGTVDYKDLMLFTDEVISKYKENLDTEKLCVTGGSYGGFMTNWIIGHTNRFKAAASQRSISNWLSKFGTSDIGYFFASDQNSGSTPWKNPEILWNHSPLKYADKCTTPTLFLNSDEDRRCWIEQGYQMFTALKYHNIASKMVIFHGENHELSRSGKPKHRIRRLKEIINWFDKYTK
ncbi:MAG: S9 family peptidase [Clostridium sp.]|nr:S9 family peptidase [Clostridium sp.]